ncbi:MAG: hypothetical protein ABSE86_31865 [Bryobacteraceae bacterium]
MGERSALVDLIRRGRRRQIRHLLVQEASFSAVLALGGAILLLLTGTQILNWYWPVLLFAGSLAVGAYRARTKMLSAYQVAQCIDGRLGLHDTLSTAYYFGEHPDRAGAPAELIERQRSAAEDLARSADVRFGLPFLAPRTFYVNAGLVLIVAAMFGLRYGINRSLDLRPPLVRIAFDGFLGSPREIADAKKIKRERPFDQDGHREQGQAVDPWESKEGNLDPAPDSVLQTVDTPEPNNPDGASDPKANAMGKEPEPRGNDPLEATEKGEGAKAGNDALSDANSSPDGNSQAGKQSSQKDSSQSANSGENSSLTDKMRDALANLMAKLKMQSKTGDGKPGSSSKQSGSQSQQRQSQSQDPNGSPSSQQQQADAAASSQSEAQQQSQSGAQQAAQGKSDSRSADRPNSPDGKSGIGKQDGDKTAREAEQLRAMGKISEIIGKRAATVTGEVMVEVASGKQQLKTQYSDRKATHVEAGGEINRDEVPLAYQQYVQQYFEEIRKLPVKSKAEPKPKTSGN